MEGVCVCAFVCVCVCVTFLMIHDKRVIMTKFRLPSTSNRSFCINNDRIFVVYVHA